MSTNNQELQARAMQGDLKAMMNLAISYYHAGDLANVEKYWVMAAEHGSDNAVYNLLCNLYGRSAGRPDALKFVEWLKKAADSENEGWGKIILGAAHCGVLRPSWALQLNACNENKTFHRLNGIELDFVKGIRLIEEGLKLAEKGDIPINYEDYESIAEAYSNRFRYFRADTSRRDHLYQDYPANYEAGNDLHTAVKYYNIAIDKTIKNDLNYNMIEIIRLVNDEISAYDEAQKSHENALKSICELEEMLSDENIAQREKESEEKKRQTAEWKKQRAKGVFILRGFIIAYPFVQYYVILVNAHVFTWAYASIFNQLVVRFAPLFVFSALAGSVGIKFNLSAMRAIIIMIIAAFIVPRFALESYIVQNVYGFSSVIAGIIISLIGMIIGIVINCLIAVRKYHNMWNAKG